MTNAEALIKGLEELDYENPVTCWIECPSPYLKDAPCEDMEYDEIRKSDICHICKLEWLQSKFTEF